MPWNCDGGTSVIRKQLGIALSGEGNILQLRQALYRCDGLFERIAIGKGRHYHVADAQSTQLIVQDSTKHFTLHSVTETDADMATQFEKTVAMPVKYEMLYVGQWKQNLLLADSYGRGRVFHTTLGHDINALSSVDFVVTLQRGTEWAATGNVTQKVPSDFPTANSVTYRSDLAAMDPAYKRGLNPLDAAPAR